MPHVLDDGYLSVTGTNLSSHVTDLQVPQGIVELDGTAMGDDSQINEPGLKNWTISFTVLNTYATDGPDATLSPLHSGRTKFGVEVRPASGAVSATNPKWTGTGFISSYEPITGSVGELVRSSVTISASSDLTRSVT